MPKDVLKNAADATRGGEDQVRDGTVVGSASKGYAEHAADGSDFNKWGNRTDYGKMAATSFK